MIKNGNHKRAFKNALLGLFISFKSERNLRLMLVISFFVIVASFLLKLSLLEFTIIVWAIFAVLSVEMINTSLEAITDLVKEEWHRQAKLAKDVAAGMVLLAVAGSIIVGSLIFTPKILKLFFNF
jgi:diacylglycerol kinase